MLNVDKTHWTVCHTHKVRWSIGSNLFSGWRNKTEEDWERNSKLLSAYEDVAPFLYPYDDNDGSADSTTHKQLGSPVGRQAQQAGGEPPRLGGLDGEPAACSVGNGTSRKARG
ncbi:hypothetical protein HJB99_08055 [Rhizobium sp. NLR17b]|uniref:hypothetical protein n=1 Tax=unclassified Rhizobium TaxID=2613769 RepID=UPI001C82FE09|nr:hypothetical protein [Rhizobium sp. NLR17b]MBX5268627.1 hypothetical protein [Rhizobium sp. NLR17b]